MTKNSFLDQVWWLTEGLDVFRREQGYLVDPDGYAARDLISLETEAVVRLSLGQSLDETDMAVRLQHAYRVAATQRVIDREKAVAVYARILPALKAPIDNLIWAEDACLYNQYLEAHLANRDFATMTYLLVRQHMETLAAHLQRQLEQTAIS